jgi:pSer/pThr/pTyr-binding forkhead associated (FHA) protein
MAKLILSLDGAFLSDYELENERTTIGRRPSNGIQIDNLAVSGEHASIMKIGKDAFLEDLGSTNGTLVNGKQITKHLLKHGDVIEFGKYQLKYVDETPAAPAQVMTEEDFEKTMVIRPGAIKAMMASQTAPAPAPVAPPPAPKVDPKPASTPVTASAEKSGERVGHLQILNGPSMGRELVLTKALTTLGKPNVQVAVITRRPQGYFVTHVEGQQFPTVNGESVGAQAHALKDHDVLELAGVKMEFYLADS